MIEIEDKYYYAFDKDVLEQFDLLSNETVAKTVNNVAKISCQVCELMIPLPKMRQHIGHHIIRKHLDGPNICGYCGGQSCESTLKPSSRKNKSIFYKVESKCDFF